MTKGIIPYKDSGTLVVETFSKTGVYHIEKENINTSKPLEGIGLNWVAGLRPEMCYTGLNYFNTINRTKSVKLFITF